MGTDHKIEEWKNLYTEIHKNAQSINTALGFVIAGTPAILGAILNFDLGDAPGGLPYLLPFIIIVPAALFIYSQLNSTSRIATYLRVFHEENSEGLQWETRLASLKKDGPKGQNHSFELSISLILGGAGILSVGAAIFQSGFYSNLERSLEKLGTPDIFLILILSLIIPVLLVYLRRITKAGEEANEYLTQWERLAGKE